MSAVYTDMTGLFAYKNLITWQLLDELGQNDAYLLNQINSQILIQSLLWGV